MPTSIDGFGPEYLAIRAKIPTEEEREMFDQEYAQLNDRQREMLEKVLSLRPPPHVLELAIQCLKDPEWMARWRRGKFKVIQGGK